MFDTHAFKALRPCAFAAAALLAACGGGSDGGPDHGAIPASMHISADVDGAAVMVTTVVEGWWGENVSYPDDPPYAYLSADEDSDSDSPALTDRNWQIYVRDPEPGSTHECAKGDAVIVRFLDGARDAADKPFTTTFFNAYKGLGECTVTIESVSAGEISGRFTATAKDGDTGATREITNGTFRVPAAIGPEPA